MQHVAERQSFSLTAGGPLYHLLIRLHTPRHRGAWLVLVLWLPLVIGGVVRAALGLPPDPTLLDLSVHVRLLVALPLLLFGEHLLDLGCKAAIRSLYDGGYCDTGALDRIVARGARLRDAWWVEAALLAIALVGGQLVLWQVIGTSRVGLVGPWSFPRVWYAVVALPVVQFVVFRWLWRWLIWSYLLARIARQPLAALATHPDRAAGLSVLSLPVTAFNTFVAAMGAVLSATWGTQLIQGRVTLPSLLPGLVVFVVVVILAALGPLLVFAGHLFRARRRALYVYGCFARDYVVQFHSKWIDHPPEGEQPLGSGDIQSLNDLGGAFHTIEETRWIVFGPRRLLEVAIAALLPMVPLFASALTIEQVLERLAKTILGGLPI